MVAGVGQAFARPVTVTFESGIVRVDSGCNGLGARFEVVASRFVVTEASGTAMACEGRLMEQEGTVLRLLESAPVISISTGGDRLWLTSPNVALQLTRQ